VIDMDEYVPLPGEPGFRAHPESGERFYSSAWLSDFAEGETPLTEELAVASGLASRLTQEIRDATGDDSLTVAYDTNPIDPGGAQVVALQARTRPSDGNIGPGGVARRAALRDAAGRRTALPEALGGSERETLRRFIAQAMEATERHLERLIDLEPDLTDKQILRGRLRQQQILRAMFEDDAA
jgi:hypothetical protein